MTDMVSVPAEKVAALREESAGWRTEAYDARKQIADLAAERDALRERIRKLAGEWDATVLVLGGTNRKPVPRWFSQRLRAALGDS